MYETHLQRCREGSLKEHTTVCFDLHVVSVPTYIKNFMISSVLVQTGVVYLIMANYSPHNAQ